MRDPARFMGGGASQVSLETEQHKPLDASDVDLGDGGVAAIKEVQRLRKLLAANHGLVQKLLLNAAVDDIADACDGEAAPPCEGPQRLKEIKSKICVSWVTVVR